MMLNYVVEHVRNDSVLKPPYYNSASLMSALDTYYYICGQRVTASAKLVLEVTGVVQLRIDLLSFEEPPPKTIDGELTGIELAHYDGKVF